MEPTAIHQGSYPAVLGCRDFPRRQEEDRRKRHSKGEEVLPTSAAHPDYAEEAPEGGRHSRRTRRIREEEAERTTKSVHTTEVFQRRKEEVLHTKGAVLRTREAAHRRETRWDDGRAREAHRTRKGVLRNEREEEVLES